MCARGGSRINIFPRTQRTPSRVIASHQFSLGCIAGTRTPGCGPPMGRVDMRDTEVRLNSRIDTTNENMQAQFAQHPPL